MCEQMMGKIDQEAKAKEYIKNIKKQVREDFGDNAEIKVSIEINGTQEPNEGKEKESLSKEDFVAFEAARLNEHFAQKAAEKKVRSLEDILEKASSEMLAEAVSHFVDTLKKEIDLFSRTVLKAYGKAR